MDKDSSRWLWFLWGRVASYALLGGLAMALGGALCVALAGALTGWIVTWSQPHGIAAVGAIFGAILGGGGGGIAGLLAFGLIGFFSPPRRRFLPPRAMLLRVFQGQVFGTLGVCASILALETAWGIVTDSPFNRGIDRDLIFILFGVPAVMICGEIVGAMSAFRREKIKLTPTLTVSE